jgi:hypothetical protein
MFLLADLRVAGVRRGKRARARGLAAEMMAKGRRHKGLGQADNFGNNSGCKVEHRRNRKSVVRQKTDHRNQESGVRSQESDVTCGFQNLVPSLVRGAFRSDSRLGHSTLMPSLVRRVNKFPR